MTRSGNCSPPMLSCEGMCFTAKLNGYSIDQK